MAAAKDARSNPRLNQSGTLSDFLLFTKSNCTLAQFGQQTVDATRAGVLPSVCPPTSSSRLPLAYGLRCARLPLRCGVRQNQ